MLPRAQKGLCAGSDIGNGRKGHSMPLYEHVFLARQDISQAQVEALTKEYSDVIEEGGGKVGKTEYWGLKTVAFKIKKNRKAHYSLMNLDAPPAAIAEMERRMGLSPDVIRFITVRVEAHETEPSIQMRKSDRDDRKRPRQRPRRFEPCPGPPPPRPDGRSTGAARPAPSPATRHRRSTTRTCAGSAATCRSAARSCRAASRPCRPRSSVSLPK